MKTLLRFTVVLCVRNEQSRLPECLEMLSHVGADEIIVVDGGSEDKTWPLLKEYQNVLAVEAGRVGLLKQRVLGVKMSRNELVALVNVDDHFSPDALSVGFTEMLAAPDLSGLQMGISSPNRTYWERCWSAYFRAIARPFESIKLLGRPALAYRRNFVDIEPPSGIFNEDTWIHLRERSAKRQYRVSSSSAVRSCPLSLQENIRQFMRYGVSDYSCTQSKADTFRLLIHSGLRIPIVRSWIFLKNGDGIYIPFLLLLGSVRTLSHILSRIRSTNRFSATKER